jgi:hypothetical protein
LKVFDGLSNPRFEIFREINHGLFPIASLTEVERAMLELIVRSTPAASIAALASHLNERAVYEAFGLVEKEMKTAAELAFARGEGGWARHEKLTDTLEGISNQA